MTLHIYDFHELTRKFGMPIHHLAVEVYGREYYYCGKGIRHCRPGHHSLHIHRQRIPLGNTNLHPGRLERMLEELQLEWPEEAYNLMGPNCQTFALRMVEKLNVAGSVPAEYCRFADGGDVPKMLVAMLGSLWPPQAEEAPPGMVTL